MSQYRARSVAFCNYYHGPLGKGRFVLTLIGLVGAAALCGSGLERLFVDRQHRTFVPNACFMESAVVTRESGRNEVFLPAWHYVATVKYKYEVNGTVFTSDVISSRFAPMVSRQAGDEFLMRFGPGMITTCYIDPDDPADAMLLLPHDGNVALWARLGGLAFALALLGLGILHFVTVIDTRPRQMSARAPGWGEIDSGPQDALSRTRGILREHMER